MTNRTKIRLTERRGAQKWACIAAVLAVTGCHKPPLCSSTVLERTFDRGSDRYATTLVRQCDADTDRYTIVLVGRTTEASADAQEVFVADTNHGLAGWGANSSIWTSVGWTNPGQLSISYASKARVLSRSYAAKSATITYRATDPIEPERVY